MPSDRQELTSSRRYHSPAPGSSAPAVALVAENDIYILPNFKRALEDLDFRVIAVKSAAEALSWLKKRVFGLVLTDMSMEDENSGLQVIAAAKRHSPNSTVVVVTANTVTRQYTEQARISGAVAVLDKDLEWRRKLRETVESVRTQHETTAGRARSQSVDSDGVKHSVAPKSAVPMVTLQQFRPTIRVGFSETLLWFGGLAFVAWGYSRLEGNAMRGLDFASVDGWLTVLSLFTGVGLLLEGVLVGFIVPATYQNSTSQHKNRSASTSSE